MAINLHCPHCNNRIEVVDAVAVGEVVCTSCGSSFKVDPARTLTLPTEGHCSLGKYILLGTVGSGAFGTVYRARDPELDRIVAVKVPRAGNLAGSDDRDRFLREARSVAQLRHAGMVPVHEVGQANGLPYLVSEFVEGMTLADYLTARRPTFREAAELIADLAESLQYAHERGVVHRDVKPSNIMLDQGHLDLETRRDEHSSDARLAKPRLMDFGLAKRDAGEITMTLEGQVLGTPAYMSPEQARGEGHRVDGRGDVYSLGVILYELLTGELPFRGNTRMLLDQVLRDEPRPLRRLNDRIPRDLETISLKCLEKSPSRRYATARDLSEDLRRYLRSEPIAARPVGPLERVFKAARRRPALTAALASGMLASAALALLAVGSWFYGQLDAAHQIAASERDAARQAQAHAAKDRDAARASEKTADEQRARAEAAEKQAQASERKARAYSYAANVRSIQRAWEENDRARYEDLIRRVEQDPLHGELKGFEWEILKGFGRNEVLRTKIQSRGLPQPNLVAISSDGARIALSNPGVGVEVIDVSTGQRLALLRDPIATRLLFHPNNRDLVTAGNDSTLKIWDVAKQECVTTQLTKDHSVSNAAFSPDGARVAIVEYHAKGKNCRVLDCKTGDDVVAPFIVNGHAANGNTVHFLSSDTVIICGQECIHWNVQTNQVVSRLDLSAYGNYFVCPTGRKIATWSGWPEKPAQDLTIISVPDKRELCEIKGVTSHFQFSPDGEHVMLRMLPYGQKYRVWNATTGEALEAPYGCVSPGFVAAWSSDLSRLAMFSGSEITVYARGRTDGALYSEANSEVNSEGTRVLANAPASPSFSSDGTRLYRIIPVSMDQWQIHSINLVEGTRDIHDLPRGSTAAIHGDYSLSRESGTFVVRHSPSQSAVSIASSLASNIFQFSTDGEWVAAVMPVVGRGPSIAFWDARTGEPRGHVALGPNHADQYFEPLAWSMNSKSRILALGFSGSVPAVKVVNTANPEQAITFEGIGPTVRLSPDGSMLAAAQLEGAKIIDVRSSKELGWIAAPYPTRRAGHGIPAFSPDGRRLAVPAFNEVVIADTGTGEELIRFATLGPVEVAFSADGSKLAAVGPGGAWVWGSTPRSTRHVRPLLDPLAKGALMAGLRRDNPGFDPKDGLGLLPGGRIQLFGEKSIQNITALRGLPITSVVIAYTGVKDLSALAGMTLDSLDCSQTAVHDLTPLRGQPLRSLMANETKITDLSPLKGMRLANLSVYATGITSLEPLRGMSLGNLNCSHTAVEDLSPLRGQPLMNLSAHGTKVADITPLTGMPLLNLSLYHTRISTLEPLRGMPLKYLFFAGTEVSDLSPLASMKLELLWCGGTKFEDLSPLSGMPLRDLRIDSNPRIKDLEPLRGMPLEILSVFDTSVSSLEPLRGMKLKDLSIRGTKVQDLAPLAGMPLTKLACDIDPKRDLAILRSLTTLEQINGKPAAQVLKELEGGQ